MGCEAHGTGSFDAVVDKAKAAVSLTTDRIHALRQAIMCCRKGGTISVPAVYVGFPDQLPLGAFMNKGLTMKTGQTHMHRYMEPLLKKIEDGRDRSVISHHAQALSLEEGPEGLQDVPRQKGRLHQGRDSAVAIDSSFHSRAGNIWRKHQVARSRGESAQRRFVGV